MKRGKTESGPRESGLLSFAGIAAVLPLGALFLVESFVFKCYQVRDASEQLSLLDAFQAWAPDAGVAIIATTIFAVLISRRPAPVRIAAVVVFYTTMLFLLVLGAGSHGYFMATGSHLSGSSIGVWLEHMGEINTVIAGEALTWKLPLVAFQILAVVVMAVLVRIGRIRRWIAGKGFLSMRRSAISLGVAFAFGAGAFLVPPLGGAMMSLSRCVPLSIAADLLSDTEDDEDDGVALPPEERLATILVFNEREGAPRPNIIVIMYESLNWKSSDVYVEGRNTTPFLMTLKDKSMVVENHYAVIPHTSKAIVPILCGIYPYMGNARRETTADVLPMRCMAHILRSVGYETAYFQPAMDFEGRSQLVKNMGFGTFAGLDDLPKQGFEAISYFGHEDKIMLEPSLEWVDSVKDDGPFFLAYMTLASHHNYVMPQSFPRTEYPEEDPDHQNYLNAIRYTDDFIRELFEGLDRRGILDETVFLIVGDHGEAFAEHARRQHDLIMWEEGLRCLSMLYSPRYLPEAGTIRGMRSHLDLVPTVCDLLGLELEEGEFVGDSMLKPAPRDRKLLHSCWFNRQCLALRDGSVKTIFHYGLQPMEVYDNAVDEHDERDLAGEVPYDDEFLTKKKREILAWRKKINLQFSEWEKDLLEGKVAVTEPEIANRLEGRFGDSVEFVGWDAHPEEVVAGGDVRVKYIFKCLEEMKSTVSMFVHVTKGRGFINADHVPVSGTYPPHRWKPGEYVVDEHVVHIPKSWAGSRARVLLGFWDKKSGKRFEVTGEKARVNDNRFLVATIKVKEGRVGSGIDEVKLREKVKDWVGTEDPQIGEGVHVVFDDKVEIVSAALTRTEVKLAGTVEMTYVFRVLDTIPDNWKLTVKLVREDGRNIDGDHDPIGGLYPTRLWREGEYVVDKHMLHIDMYECKTGKYKIWLGFEKGSRSIPAVGAGEIDKDGRVLLGEVTINPKTERQ